MSRSSSSRRTRVGSPAILLAVEALEVRRLLASIMVTTTADGITPDDGVVTLREAITAINAGNAMGDPDILAQNPGAFGSGNTIHFAIPQPAAGATVQSINVGEAGNGALPALTRPVTIDGYSEAGASANTLAVGDNAKVLVELSGADAGPNASGLVLAPGSGGSTIEGVAVNRFSANGINVESNGNVVEGVFAGTNPQGNAQEPNQVDGIRITGASNNTIGGTTPAARNLASGNHNDGVHVVGTLAAPATHNLVEGNYVGTNAAGTGSVGIKPNGGATGTPDGNSFFGIEISGGNNNTVGGVSSSDRNVVGFNAAGIEVDEGGQGNVIQGNYSGVGADGATPIGNNLHGIVIRSSGSLPAPLGPGQPNEPAVANNVIGLNPVTLTGLGNLVEFNGTGGVAIFGNPLPNNPNPAQNNGNSILGNSIFENGRGNPSFLLGIDLTNTFTFPKDDGATPNDSKGHGAANDPNNFQNAPVLSSVTQAGGGVHVTGSLTQKVSPNTKYRIEFYANNPDPLGGAAEGQTLIGATTVTTGASGSASFSVTVGSGVSAGQIITADATNLTADPSVRAGSANLYNTSEFSPGVALKSTTTAPVVNHFELLNPANGADLGRLNDGAVISLSALHVSSLNVASFASPAAQSTTFSLNGVYEGLSSATIQSLLDAEHSKNGLGVGKYTLTVQAFSQTFARGAASSFATVHFQIVA